MYGSIPGWMAYNTERGLDTGEILDPESLPVLVRASDYIRFHYVVNFMAGYDDTLPEVEMATYEAANIEKETPGFFNGVYTPSQAKVLVNIESIRWERIPDSREVGLDHNKMVPVSLKIDMMLRRFMRSNSRVGLVSLGRVSERDL
jgi:hypothetical protein